MGVCVCVSVCQCVSYSNNIWHTTIENVSESFVVYGMEKVGAKGVLIQESE